MASRQDEIRAELDKLVASLNLLSEKAQDEVLAGMLKIPPGTPINVTRDELIKHLEKTLGKYRGGAASLTADWYETLRRAVIDEDFSATLADDMPSEEIDAKVRWLMTRLNDNPDALDSLTGDLSSFIDRVVKAGSRETIIKSVKNDPSKPRFARVPAGNETCPFCRMLASRGFVYTSEKAAAGIKRGYHGHCDCVIVPAWGKPPKIRGYKPDKDYTRYEAARDALEKELGYSIGLKPVDIVAKMRELYPDIYPRTN